MKNKIKDYIDLIFADAPDCARTREVKEEMYANVCDKYDDLIKDGKSESAAYNISISGIGDISELIETIKAERRETREEYANPYSSAEYRSQRQFTEKEKQEIEAYRKKRGVMNSVAVALYIICWIPLVAISVITETMGGNEDIAAIIGLSAMMVIIAAATVLMIMKSSIKPLCLKGIKDSEFDDDDDDDDDDEKPKTGKRRKNPLLTAISSALWAMTVVGYIIVSFMSGAWHITWIIFPIATAIDNIIEAIFELCGKKYV